MFTTPPRRRFGAAALAITLALAACDHDAAGPDPDEPLPALTLDRAAAPPGTPIRVTGVEAGDDDGAALELLVDGVTAPLIRVSPDTLVTAVPLFLDESGIPDIPAGAVDVVLHVNGAPAAAARRALTVQPLPAAPMTTARTLEQLHDLGELLTRLSWRMRDEPGVETQYWFALTSALQEVLVGDDDRSLKNTIDALSPAQREVLDGVLATTGLSAALEQLAGQIFVLVDQSPATFLEADAALALPASRGQLVSRVAAAGAPTRVSGVGLAYRMQLHEVAALFAQTVVAPTATTYANTVGIAAGLFGVGGVSLPPVQIIGAVVAIADFVINKLAIGLLPARVDSFTMELGSTLIPLGGITDARLHIVASNEPPPISVQDVVGVILAGLGGVPVEQKETLRTVLADAASFYFSTMQSFLAQYSNAHPEANLDVQLLQLPVMTWEADIVDHRLVESVTLTPDIITGLPGTIDWRGSSTNRGDGRIYARTAVGPVFVALPPGIEYNGGVFGDDVVATETFTVEVGGRFDGQWVGTYTGGGGCLGLNGAGSIALSIKQNGPVLSVTFALSPGIEDFAAAAGQAMILSETPNTFLANIVQPAFVTGLLSGSMTEDRTEISGELGAQAEWVCDGEPQIIPATGTYTVKRQP